jgi:hypothetical protein
MSWATKAGKNSPAALPTPNAAKINPKRNIEFTVNCFNNPNHAPQGAVAQFAGFLPAIFAYRPAAGKITFSNEGNN